MRFLVDQLAPGVPAAGFWGTSLFSFCGMTAIGLT